MENPPEIPKVTSRQTNPQMPGMFRSVFLMVTWNIYRAPTFTPLLHLREWELPQSAQHRVDHGTICGRSGAISGHHKPPCACVSASLSIPKAVAPGARKNSGSAG